MEKKLNMWGDKCVNLIGGVLSQFKCISNHHHVHFKYLNFYLSTTCQYSLEKKEK